MNFWLEDKGYNYQIVADENLSCKNKSLSNLLAFLKIRGIECSSVNLNNHNREELQGQPIFPNLCGPMYNGQDKSGVPIIRYESAEVYRKLSY